MPNQSLIESGAPPNLLLVCNAIIISRSTNLSVMKDYLRQLLENEQTVSSSHYKRLIRFFNISDSANSKLIDCILGMIYKTLSESVRAAFRKYLILDGTQWKRGEKYVHLLTLCLVYHGIIIPIYWHQLNKKGDILPKKTDKNYLPKPVNVINFQVKFYLQTVNLLVKNGYHFW